MTTQEAVENRHSVRSYSDRKIDGNIKAALDALCANATKESGILFKLVTDDDSVFSSFFVSYGLFHGVNNYIIVAGEEGADGEKAGYYGEAIVLEAVQMGLGTCWVAGTYSRKNASTHIPSSMSILAIIAIGYAAKEGKAHKSKSATKVSSSTQPVPTWFENGVRAALLAPTALNQQKFFIKNEDGVVSAEALPGKYTILDLGIVKYNFEVGAGKENFKWK